MNEFSTLITKAIMLYCLKYIFSVTCREKMWEWPALQTETPGGYPDHLADFLSFVPGFYSDRIAQMLYILFTVR